MKLDIVLGITRLIRIVRTEWNVTPIVMVENDVNFIFVANQHHAGATYVAAHLNAQQHCGRYQPLLGHGQVRFPAQINVPRNHLMSFYHRACSIVRAEHCAYWNAVGAYAHHLRRVVAGSKVQ